jgi:uncharacterized protein (TIGR02145 family)
MKCLILLTFMMLFVSCSSDVASVENYASTENGENISGLSQKGPVLAGASVVIQELDSVTLLQTGKSFKGVVVNDNGEFVVENVNLKSPYVLLEVNGYFRNEVTGKNSEGPVFMKAIADVGEQKRVNVNLLTHLEYQRVQTLLEREGMSIAEAKRVADREILSAFYGESLNEDSYQITENLDIFGDSESDAALLAINVLLLGEGNEAEFMENFAKLGEDLAEDGVWNDSLLMARIADVACEMSFDNALPKIRKNIENWKIANKIVSFEPYVTSFWERVYGFGTCNASNLGAVKKNSAISSAYYGMEFTCGESGQWTANLNVVRAGCDSCGFMVDSRDGHKYRTIRIAGLNWMAENLAYNGEGEGTLFHDDKSYGLYYNLVAYPTFKDGGAPDSSDAEWTIYTTDGYGTYVYALRTSCPDGWRLPTREDFARLFEFTSENDYEQLLSEKKWNLHLYSLDESISYLSSTKVPGDPGRDFGAPSYYYYVMKASGKNDSLVISVDLVRASNGFIRCVEGGAYERKMLSPSEVAVDSVVDERDGMVYKTLQFGNQLWMAKNMEYAIGDSLINGEVRSATYFGVSTVSVWQKMYDSSSVGWRYNWKEVQDACPNGWKVPSRSDVKKLLKIIGDGSGAAPLLSADGIDAQDIYGFSALSTEFERVTCASLLRGCSYKHVGTRFWTADSADGTVYHWYLGQYDVTFEPTDPADYLPVRCMKDI